MEKCPLCSADVPKEDLEEHVQRELDAMERVGETSPSPDPRVAPGSPGDNVEMTAWHSYDETHSTLQQGPESSGMDRESQLLIEQIVLEDRLNTLESDSEGGTLGLNALFDEDATNHFEEPSSPLPHIERSPVSRPSTNEMSPLAHHGHVAFVVPPTVPQKYPQPSPIHQVTPVPFEVAQTGSQDEFSQYYQRMFGEAPPPGVVSMDFENRDPEKVIGRPEGFSGKHQMRMEGRRRRIVRCCIITPCLCLPLIILVLGIVFSAPRDAGMDITGGRILEFSQSGNVVSYKYEWDFYFHNRNFFPTTVELISCKIYHYYDGTAYYVDRLYDTSGYYHQGQDKHTRLLQLAGTIIDDGDAENAGTWMGQTIDDNATEARFGVLCEAHYKYWWLENEFLDFKRYTSAI